MPALHAWCISIMATRGRHLVHLPHIPIWIGLQQKASLSGDRVEWTRARSKRPSICKLFSCNIFKKKFWMALPLWLCVCVHRTLTRRCACVWLPVSSYPHVHRLSDFKASRILVNSRIRYSRNSRILVTSRIRNSRNSRILVNSRIRNSRNSRFADSEFENSQEF
jgi:hypothetical protein